MNFNELIFPFDGKAKLSDFSTGFNGEFKNKTKAKEYLEDGIEKLAKLQYKLYAEDKYSVLLIFQAMDAAGKDSTIKHVMSGVNPQGCQVYSFKVPSSEELDHGYLWRCQKAMPERGRIGIFNRSYYEEVLVVKVHPKILLSQKLPGFKIENAGELYEARYEEIRNLEKYLGNTGTVVIKFFLNVSKKEQKKRFLERINNPEKSWKFSMNDIKERQYWGDYMKAYEKVLKETSTKEAPWYVIPADNKWYMRAAVCDIIVQRLEELKLKIPEVSDDHNEILQQAKISLENEK